MDNKTKDKRCTIFLKKRDYYALPVNITYDGLKTFPTSTGGILSMLSTILLGSWLIFNVFNILNFKYTLSSSLEVVSIAGSDNSIWSINLNQTIMAFQMFTSNTAVFPGNVTQYISAIYMQESYNETDNNQTTFTYYNATNCANLAFVGDSESVKLIEKGWMCPNLTGANIELQGQIGVMPALILPSNLTVYKQKSFKLMIGYCEDFKNYTE